MVVGSVCGLKDSMLDTKERVQVVAAPPTLITSRDASNHDTTRLYEIMNPFHLI